MEFPAVWKNCTRQGFHNIVKEIVSVVSMLLSHWIDKVKSIDPPNNSQHELFSPDSVLDFMRDLVG
jgi:phage-related holin